MLNVPCYMDILGVRIDNLSKKEILEKIELFLSENKFHQIATVNPEFILTAQKDVAFKNILNESDLNVADGIGLKYAFVRYGGWLKKRMAGIDLMHEILYLAYKHNYKIFVAANSKGLSKWQEISSTLSSLYPTLEVDGADIEPGESMPLAECSKHDILLCNFGAPHQEKFINSIKNSSPIHLCNEIESNGNDCMGIQKCSSDLSLRNERCRGKIKLAMGVGGAFDFVTGKFKRAPKWMRKFGLEWLWRLIQEPKYRIKRILKAVIVFPFRVLINR